MWQIFYLWAGLIPLAVLLAAVSIDRWKRKHRGERSPLSEKLLRPAGHSLRLKLDELDETFDFWFVGTALLSVTAVGAIGSVPKDFGSRIVILFVFGLGAAGCAVVAWRRVMEIRAYRRGLLGEQAVAEQLQELLAFRYHVFHDVPGDGSWNIDHVVVGPGGVFAIETKYRTKRPGKALDRDHEAIFDGRKIQFPSGFDVDAAQQAIRNARWLANLLSKSLGERIAVRPLVALPGWLVTLKANSEVKVLSGKQVPGFIATEPMRLSDKAIQQISFQLDQRCRDVEL